MSADHVHNVDHIGRCACGWQTGVTEPISDEGLAQFRQALHPTDELLRPFVTNGECLRLLARLDAAEARAVPDGHTRTTGGRLYRLEKNGYESYSLVFVPADTDPGEPT